jgi:hypothetical protein
MGPTRGWPKLAPGSGEATPSQPLLAVAADVDGFVSGHYSEVELLSAAGAPFSSAAGRSGKWQAA